MEDTNEARSLRADLASLVVTENDAHASGYNAALRDVLMIFDRHDVARKKSSKRALAKLKHEGKKTGGDLPYGYELAADGVTLRESSSEQLVITVARELRSAGHSLRDVARCLKERGLLPRENDEFCAAQIKRLTDERKPTLSFSAPAAK
jgi:hypothetical protein